MFVACVLADIKYNPVANPENATLATYNSRAVASPFEVVRSVGVANLRPLTTPLVTFHIQRVLRYN